jgi:hypothetical protein
LQGDEVRTPFTREMGGMAPYYRIELEGYEELSEPLPIRPFLREYSEEIGHDLEQNAPKYYLLNTCRDIVRLVEGHCLTRCTPELYENIGQALSIQESTGSPALSLEELKKLIENAKRSGDQ